MCRRPDGLQSDLPNLSISVGGGKESNFDGLSNGERNGLLGVCPISEQSHVMGVSHLRHCRQRGIRFTEATMNKQVVWNDTRNKVTALLYFIVRRL